MSVTEQTGPSFGNPICHHDGKTWEAPMGLLMLKCPTTGQEFSTDIHVEEDSFKRLADTVTKAACPHCGALHSWWTHEARLANRIEPGGAS
jgi:hypothetical protein